MAWVVFTAAEFRTWHDAECQARGIPKPGRRQSDGTVQVDAEWTTSWVKPAHTVTIQGVTYHLVDVPDPTGLREATVVWNADKSISVTYKGRTATATPAVTDVATKPKPQSIVIDGVTYTRSK